MAHTGSSPGCGSGTRSPDASPSIRSSSIPNSGPIEVDCRALFTEDQSQALLVLSAPPRTEGWDPVTGWGSPDAQVLIPLLARYTTP